MEVGVIPNWIPATPAGGKDNQCPIVPETRCIIHAVSAGFMWGRNTAKMPRSPLVLARPAFHVTFPSAMRGLVEYGGDYGPIRHLRQNWPCADIVNGYVSLCGHVVSFPQDQQLGHERRSEGNGVVLFFSFSSMQQDHADPTFLQY